MTQIHPLIFLIQIHFFKNAHTHVPSRSVAKVKSKLLCDVYTIRNNGVRIRRCKQI